MTKKYLDDLTYKVIGACINVHKELGPGLLESVYQKCLKYEFRDMGVDFKSEMSVEMIFKGKVIDADLRCDFLIEDTLVLELKAVEYVLPVHDAQVFTYMKLLQCPKGVLVNFNCTNVFKEGQKTFVNELYRNLPEK